MSHARYALSEDEDERIVTRQAVKEEPVTRITDERPAIVQLSHAWLNERGSPELQPWPAEIVDTVLDQLQQQQSILDSLMSDTSTSEEEHFRLNLVQLDAERSKWLLRSFLRTRLEKLEKYASHLVTNRSEQTRLSPMELGYVKRYDQLLSDHFQNAVLQYLPEPMRSLNDPPPGGSLSNVGSMIVSPQLDSPVFIYCRDDGGSIVLPDGESLALLPGSIHLLPYRAIRAVLEQRRVELL